MRRTLKLLTVAIFGLALASCAGQPFLHGSGELPGFWWGLLHGMTAPFAFIASLLVDDIRIYAAPNIGVWYDFGFVLGGGIFAGAGR
jgi:hypothetical protein